MASGGFSKLSRISLELNQGWCRLSPCSMEEVALAVGQVIGHSLVRSAARMNKAVVLFVEKVEQVNRLVETGITVNGTFEPVLPLTQPVTRITLSNAPPEGCCGGNCRNCREAAG